MGLPADQTQPSEHESHPGGPHAHHIPAHTPPVETPHNHPSRARRTIQRLAFLTILLIGLVFFLESLPAQTRAGLLVALRRERSLIGMLLLFIMVSISLVWSAGQRLDARIFEWINLRGFRPAWLDEFMNLATQIGNVVTALALGNLFFYMGNRRLAIEILLGTVSLWMVVESLKLATDRSRPYLALEVTRVVGWRERGRSFPSGHTAQTFFLMTLLARSLHADAGLSILFYGIAVLVGLTRMYVGVHYPRDVAGGALLGTAWGVLASVLEPYLFGQ